MAYESKKLREERYNLCEKQRALVIKATEEKRSLTPDETQQFDKLDSEANRMLSEAEGYERMEKFNKTLLDQGAPSTAPRSNRIISKEDRNNALLSYIFR